jgi:hypothetical protein
MSAKSTKGTKICITSPTATGTALVPTAIVSVAAAASKPAGIKVTVANTATVGEVVSFKNTGFASLDDKSFIITTATATDFDITNVTLGTGTLGASPEAHIYAEATDMTCLCLSSFSVSTDQPNTISVATYCDPTASIPGSATAAGTVSFAGYVDVTAKDYPALLAAVEDGKQRVIRITLPGNGYLVAPVTFSQISWDIPLDGGIGFNGSASLGSKLHHVW